jgi:hypothetical protein
MVFYKCNKCFKEFTKKYNYVTHINRKFTCNTIIDKDLLITQLQDENIQLKNENKIVEFYFSFFLKYYKL